MEGKAERCAAQVVPVAARVEQVEVPDLVDVARGRDRMAGAGGEIEEAPVLGDGAGGFVRGPARFTGEPGGEGECAARRIECEG